ncbi:hypothetical protein GT037_009319 [Alternaria burnsii]|uniref:Uncharacterized protein n=1 Tax=Alternaria burnsii TaxID=1187904 RepID=A0A8H7AY36_9PLEO|nr:uncharacterized protein GT037_009319 [Alternaria burnsii]KAF7672818.1 hypothetical protein GT037_009319 [Alternaria burnsii]
MAPRGFAKSCAKRSARIPLTYGTTSTQQLCARHLDDRVVTFAVVVRIVRLFLFRSPFVRTNLNHDRASLLSFSPQPTHQPNIYHQLRKIDSVLPRRANSKFLAPLTCDSRSAAPYSTSLDKASSVSEGHLHRTQPVCRTPPQNL